MIAASQLSRSTTPRRVVLGVLVALITPGFLFACLVMGRFKADWHGLFPAAKTIGEASKQIPLGIGIATVSGDIVGLIFTVPALVAWPLLHRAGLTQWFWFCLTGLAVGLCVSLVIGTALPPMWFVYFEVAGAATGLLVWSTAYAGRPIKER